MAALRAALAWLHGAVLVLAFALIQAGLVRAVGRHDPLLDNPISLLSLAPVVAYVAVVFWWMRRPFHDRLARTYLVPK
jgi:hypothetical protein